MDAHDLRRLDEIAAAATPATRIEDVEGWRCRWSPEVPFRRCNTVVPPAGAAADEDRLRRSLAAVRAWCAARGGRVIVQVSEADPEHERLDHLLAEAALVVEAPVVVMVGPVGGDLPPAPAGVAVGVRHGVDGHWGATLGTIEGGETAQSERAAAYGRMLAPLGERALGASAAVTGTAGTIVGSGLGVVDGGWLGVFGMATAPAHRRRGVASAVLGALGESAATQGAERAYLQVEAGNAEALALYARRGFVASHRYHYRSEGVDPRQGC